MKIDQLEHEIVYHLNIYFLRIILFKTITLYQVQHMKK